LFTNLLKRAFLPKGEVFDHWILPRIGGLESCVKDLKKDFPLCLVLKPSLRA